MAEKGSSEKGVRPARKNGNGAAAHSDAVDDANLNRPSVIPLTYPDKESLHRSYMPFVKGGGLFLPTSKRYTLNEEVFLLVTLPNSDKSLPVPGRVVWQTPAGAMDARRQGIGIEFNGREGHSLRNQIEGLLGARVSSARETYTM